jgi:hypothetical protein
VKAGAEALDEYSRLDLRAHELLAGVPLHDLWIVDLAGGGPARTIADVRARLALDDLLAANPVVRTLFGVRTFAGRLFGWDEERPESAREGLVARLAAEDRERSLVPPGTPDGPFRVVFVGESEAISEVVNATAHAFSVLALRSRPPVHRLYWAIYVRPVGRITSWYLAAIEPFRRWIVYPAVLRHLERTWAEDAPRSRR